MVSHTYMALVLFVYYYIYMRELGRQILHLLVYSQDDHDSRGWAKRQDLYLVSHMVTESQVHMSSSVVLLGILSGSWIKSGADRTQTNVHTT